MSDGELVRLAQRGDRSAYEQLVQRWSPRVLARCHAKVRCRHTAEELSQESLLRGLRALGTLADPEKFGPWLCGIAVRACLDWLKCKQAGQVSFGVNSSNGSAESLIAQPGPMPDAEAELADDVRQLLHAVEALPEECREVLLLYYYDDVTYRDIAALLEVSPATVNVRLTKARAMLRERLLKLSEGVKGCGMPYSGSPPRLA